MSVTNSSKSPSTLDVQNLRVANTLHSKTRSLPYETLSYIFQHACPEQDAFEKHSFEHFHLVLQLVSSLWYQVVQSTPQLWTSFRLPFDTAAEKMKDHIKLAFRNSGQLGLHIIFGSKSDYAPDGEWVIEILEPVLHRIECLRVLRRTPKWFGTVFPKMCRLRAACLPDTETIPRGDTTLEWMRLQGATPCAIDIPLMTSITYLDLLGVDIDCSIQFLIQCPNLVVFHCFFPEYAQADATAPTTTIVLNKLRLFSWSVPVPSDSKFHDMLFKHLHLPALEYFHFANPQGVEFDEHTFAFFSRLPKTLKRLKFDRMGYRFGKRFLHSLDKDIEIESIHIVLCNSLFLKDTFSFLSEMTDQGKFRLPHLTSLHLKINEINSACELDLPAWVEDRLALMLEERAGMINKFTFSVDCSYWLIENEASWRNFKELKLGGLDVKLIDLRRVLDL